MVVALGSPSIQSAPTGIGSLADNGCTCHGGYSNTTQPIILGLPEKFGSNITYDLTLSVEAYSGQHSESAQGGFRLLISNGSVEIQNQSRVQFLDGGWTHTESGNQYRSWNLTWTAPSDNTTTVDFVLHGNAVNGNGNSEGDMWNSFGTVLPGAQHEDVVKLLDNSGASNPGWKPRAPQETMLSGAKIVRNQSIAEKYLSRHQRLAMRCIAEGRGAGPHPR